MSKQLATEPLPDTLAALKAALKILENSAALNNLRAAQLRAEVRRHTPQPEELQVIDLGDDLVDDEES